MDQTTWVALVSIVMAGLTIAIVGIAGSVAQGRAVSQALESLARQPDASDTITRTLFVGLALIESFAIYAFLISMVLIFFNPFWNQVTGGGG